MKAPEFSSLYVCPQTRLPLRLCTDVELEALRKREGCEKLEAVWIRSDRAVAYPVKNRIPLLVASAAIPIKKTRPKPKSFEDDSTTFSQ
jgi:uncharacterized protein YbaR (Trm112 family)